MKKKLTIFVALLLVAIFFSTVVSHIPKIGIEMIYGIEFLFALFIVLSCFVNKWKTGFPTLILYFALFSLLININLLSPLKQIEDYSILRFFKLKMFCDKYLLGVPLALPLLIINLFVSKSVSRIEEVSVHFAKDTKDSKFLNIEKLNGATKFLSGSIKFTIFVSCINISIGILLEIFKNNLNFYDSLKATIPNFCMKIILITVPYIIVGLATSIRINSLGQTETL